MTGAERKTEPRTATDRSRARFRRAARVLGGVTLNAAQADALARILAASGETAADWVRRMIAAHDPRDQR